MQEDIFKELENLLINVEDAQVLCEELENYHCSDIADVLQTLTKEERLRIYGQIGIEHTSDVFEYYTNVEDYIEELTPDMAADVLERMDSNDAIDVLNELDSTDKQEIIELMEDEAQTNVKMIDSYDEELIGSYMSDNFIVIDKNLTIKQAMNTMIKMAGDHDNIYVLYVNDEDNKFYGAIQLKDLICARLTDKLEDLIMTSYPSFYDDELMSDCINKLVDYAESSIPVLNRNDEIIGVITGDTVIDAQEDEYNDDYAKFGGLTEEEDIDESVFESVKKRMPWLVVLLFLSFIVSSVIGVFEEVIAVLPVVVFFQSMILGMAGNSGTQSLAVTIRNISQDEPKEKNTIIKSILKEIRVGFFNGLIVAVVGFVFVLLYLTIRRQGITSTEFIFTDVLQTSFIISGSLLIAMTVSSLIGTAFPIFLNKIGIDPAVASGPFITTFNDIVAVLVYYGLVYLFFIVF